VSSQIDAYSECIKLAIKGELGIDVGDIGDVVLRLVMDWLRRNGYNADTNVFDFITPPLTDDESALTFILSAIKYDEEVDMSAFRGKYEFVDDLRQLVECCKFAVVDTPIEDGQTVGQLSDEIRREHVTAGVIGDIAGSLEVLGDDISAAEELEVHAVGAGHESVADVAVISAARVHIGRVVGVRDVPALKRHVKTMLSMFGIENERIADPIVVGGRKCKTTAAALAVAIASGAGDTSSLEALVAKSTGAIQTHRGGEEMLGDLSAALGLGDVQLKVTDASPFHRDRRLFFAVVHSTVAAYADVVMSDQAAKRDAKARVVDALDGVWENAIAAAIASEIDLYRAVGLLPDKRHVQVIDGHVAALRRDLAEKFAIGIGASDVGRVIDIYVRKCIDTGCGCGTVVVLQPNEAMKNGCTLGYLCAELNLPCPPDIAERLLTGSEVSRIFIALNRFGDRFLDEFETIRARGDEGGRTVVEVCREAYGEFISTAFEDFINTFNDVLNDAQLKLSEARDAAAAPAADGATTLVANGAAAKRLIDAARATRQQVGSGKYGPILAALETWLSRCGIPNKVIPANDRRSPLKHETKLSERLAEQLMRGYVDIGEARKLIERQKSKLGAIDAADLTENREALARVFVVDRELFEFDGDTLGVPLKDFLEFAITVNGECGKMRTASECLEIAGRRSLELNGPILAKAVRASADALRGFDNPVLRAHRLGSSCYAELDDDWRRRISDKIREQHELWTDAQIERAADVGLRFAIEEFATKKGFFHESTLGWFLASEHPGIPAADVPYLTGSTLSIYGKAILGLSDSSGRTVEVVGGDGYYQSIADSYGDAIAAVRDFEDVVHGLAARFLP
jgi:hypothetical protein